MMGSNLDKISLRLVGALLLVIRTLYHCVLNFRFIENC